MQHYEYVEYIDCNCNLNGSENNICNKITGKCTCQNEFICGQNCDQCCDGYYAHPNCQCEYFNNSIYFMDIYMSDENHGTAIFQHVPVIKRVLQGDSYCCDIFKHANTQRIMIFLGQIYILY